MITVEQLAYQYPDGNFRLSVPDLRIEKGATVAVVGPSGTGKTTFLNLLAGIRTPQSGRVSIDGEVLSSLHDAARRDFRIRSIGLVFQEFELVDHLHVLDNILLPYRLNPALRRTPAVHRRAQDLAGQVGMRDKLKRNVRHLSQGERQRVAICRALLPEPPVLLCDEPTGNLDVDNKHQVLDCLFGYTAAHGTTLVTVTHDRELVGRFDRTVDFRAFTDS